jgi:hypothetical protein
MIVKRLLKWLKRLPDNSHFDPSIEVFKSSSGYGIRATKEIPISQTVIRIPVSGWKVRYHSSYFFDLLVSL